MNPANEEHTFEVPVQARYLDEFGRELPNPIPMQPPIGYVKQPSMQETMRAMIQQASYEAAMAGAETDDEADDFDVGPDGFEHDYESRYFHDFERDPIMEEMLAMKARESRPPSPTDTKARDNPPAPATQKPAESPLGALSESPK